MTRLILNQKYSKKQSLVSKREINISLESDSYIPAGYYAYALADMLLGLRQIFYIWISRFFKTENFY